MRSAFILCLLFCIITEVANAKKIKVFPVLEKGGTIGRGTKGCTVADCPFRGDRPAEFKKRICSPYACTLHNMDPLEAVFNVADIRRDKAQDPQATLVWKTANPPYDKQHTQWRLMVNGQEADKGVIEGCKEFPATHKTPLVLDRNEINVKWVSMSEWLLIGKPNCKGNSTDAFILYDDGLPEEKKDEL